MATNDIYYRYFMYSTEHMQLKKKMYEKQGKNLKLGTVIVNGVPKKYTDMVASKANYKYTDAKVIVEGDKRKINFTPEED